MSKKKHPEDSVCGECGEDLNTSNSHNWRCENEDCDAYHMGDRDLQDSNEPSSTRYCTICEDWTFSWTRRTSKWVCEECGAGSEAIGEPDEDDDDY